MKKVGALVVVAALFWTGCGTEGGEGGDQSGRRGGSANAPPIVSAVSLERFDACPEFVRHVRAEARKRVGPYGLPGGFATMADGLVAAERSAVAGATADSAAAAPAPKSFSQTNVQEESVDEPDTVKTDGRHIFTLRPAPTDQRQRLTAIATEEGKPRLAGTLALPEGASYELLLAGDRILAMSASAYAAHVRGMERVPVPFEGDAGASRSSVVPEYKPQTIVAVIDASDPGRMRIVNKLVLDGTYASARMVDGIARIVLNTSSSKPKLETPTEPTPQGEKDALERNRQLIERSDPEDWLPRFELQDDSGKVVGEGPVSSCSTIHHPKTFSGFDQTSVVTIDPANPDPRNSAAVLGGAGTVYASTGNLYVATQRWPDVQPLVIEDRPVGAPEPFPAPPNTQIHRFDIGDPARASYAASGEVKGTVLNQWSLSEHDGHLRVATTDTRFDNEGSSSESFVTVFDARAPRLIQVGQVGGLGKDERIYGVRFMGDVGYVVTFRQIDPLYVVDLAAPDRPRVLGELKIPGYSAYLHPVGDGRIIGIGQDASTEGVAEGTQVSLFDVSDPAAPKQLDKVVFKQATSPVEHDHHAFLWWEPSKLAVVPINQYQNALGGERGSAVGFRFADDQIREVGRASHLSHSGGNQDWVLSTISRSLVVGEELYTLSHNGVLASDLGSFAERGWLSFGA